MRIDAIVPTRLESPISPCQTELQTTSRVCAEGRYGRCSQTLERLLPRAWEATVACQYRLPPEVLVAEMSRGTTMTSARASCGCGTAKTRTGRFLATSPKSTIHTSPGVASILTECVLPNFPLLGRCHRSFRRCRDSKRHVVSKFDLCQKNVEGIARLHPKPGKYLLGPLQAVGRNTCTEQG